VHTSRPPAIFHLSFFSLLSSFCFACISRWAAVESRCPFCKARFGLLTRVRLDEGEATKGDGGAPAPAAGTKRPRAEEERDGAAVIVLSDDDDDDGAAAAVPPPLARWTSRVGAYTGVILGVEAVPERNQVRRERWGQK